MIEVEACVVVQRPRPEVFAAAATNTDNLAKFFSGYALLIPAITSASIDGGGEPREGAMRSVSLSDGTHIRERITRFEVPAAHGYEIVEMNALQRLFCTTMISLWTFADEGSATRVVWHYTIVPKGPFTRPLAWGVGRLFQRAMQRCLEDLAASLR